MSAMRRSASLARRVLVGASLVTLGAAVLSAPVIIGVRNAGNPSRLAVVVVVLAATFFVAAVIITRLVPPLGRRLVLELDLTKAVPEVAVAGAAGLLPGRRPTATVRDLVEGLERAGQRKRVVGLVAILGGGVEGLARISEIRAAVAAFRQSGKPAVAFAETFGEFSQGTGSYFLATAFDEIVMQPSGDVGVTGVMAVAPFLRGALDKVGIETQMDHRHEYKAALNTFTERSFTDAHRESYQRIIDSQLEGVIAAAASARGLDEVELRRRIDQGPYLGDEAVEAGFVDRLGYRDGVVDELEARTRGELVPFEKWWKRARRRRGRGATVAVVYGTGQVVRGTSRFAVPGGQAMGSDSVVKALKAAREDKRTKAVVFRVDSPGGSYVASDAIWRETVRLREAGKPLIVSMGNVAGSGGYFVAIAADRIVAQPGTITGSIGVVGGKQVITEALGKLGVTVDSVQVGARAGMFSPVERYTDEEWARMQAALDRIYDDFTGKVAEGRGMSRDAVHAVAKGRVWTGADAHELGLVDTLGGFAEARAAARELAGLDVDAPVRFRDVPRRRPLAGLTGLVGGDEDTFAVSWRGLADDATAALGLTAPSVLALPPWCTGTWWR